MVAALLKEAGHDVVGITLQLYDHGEATGREGSCCAGQDVHDARRVAHALGIPHYVLDYEQRFADSVIRSFADSYAAGETPVPCITCNQQIKFGDLLATTRELGADILATGHYIQRRDGPAGPALHRAADASRDQSYFLFATTKAQLASVWFPLGGLHKADVRALAARLALPVAEKPDSQDICFVPKGRYTQIVQRLHPDAAEPGDVVHVDGRVLGRHAGTFNFTVGQRRGLKIASSEPLYVVELNPGLRRVIVGPRSCLQTESVMIRDVNWLGDGSIEEAAASELEVFARVRSSQLPQPAVIGRDERTGAVRVTLTRGEHGVAAGQACVLYADGSTEARVLGGGWISGKTPAAAVRAGHAVAPAAGLV
jgi:tRNA-specific 2-thiouridylase